jgi:hypothetical protein
MLTLAATLFASTAVAGPVSFSSGWQEQRLSLFSSNDYSFGQQLSMVSDGAVSIAWTRLPQGEWNATSASWNWRVDQSVPATDLSRKGGDDRNLSIYFVFVPEAVAAELSGAGIRSLLGRNDVRVMQYAWGGNHGRGTIIPSPYGQGGVTIPLRQASTGSHSESVDLAADHRRAFGTAPGALVGLAVSGDSDDTNSVIRAAIGGLTLR